MIGLLNGEKVEIEVRRHWFLFALESAALGILALIPIGALGALDAVDPAFRIPDAGAFLFFASSVWWLIVWVMFVIAWTNYYLDAWVLTPVRLVDIEQHGLFRREMSECRLDRIQDVTVEVRGILPTLLKFGDVHVQTAGEMRRFTLKSVPDPYGVKDRIVRMQEYAMRRNGVSDSHA